MKHFIVLTLFILMAGCATNKKTANNKTPHDRVVALIEAAQAALIEKDPIGALQFLKSAEEAEPGFAPIYHTRAMAFHMRKDFTKAIEEMKKCVELDPSNSYSNNSLGKMLMDAGKGAEAEKYLLKAAQDPTFRESFKAKTSLGILHYRLGNLAQADVYLEKATDDDPVNSCIAYYYRGHIALKKDKLKTAQDFYARASKKFCAGFPDAHYALGLVFEKSRQVDAARKKYLEIKQNFPESAQSEQAMERLKLMR